MIGKTVGHYRITARLGAGGMGEVFLGEDTRLERKAAIKFLPEEMAADPERRQRFLTEARAASALNHPHVCVVYDVGETEDGLPFIAMEFVQGQSLSDLVKQGPLEISRVVAIAVQVADALDAAHSRRIVRQIGRQEFDRRLPVEPCVFRQEHFPHPARAEPGGDAVVANRGADHESCVPWFRR